jgi:SprT protein
LSAFFRVAVNWVSLLPNERAAELVVPLATAFAGTIDAVAPRSSKWGDFRPAHDGKPARIRVNRDLPPDAFLLTLLHELAHALVDSSWQARKAEFSGGLSPLKQLTSVLRGRPARPAKPAPHGSEWQAAYRAVVTPFLAEGVFQPGVARVLEKSLCKPKASCGADPALLQVLRPKTTERPHVRDLPEGSAFRLVSGRAFVKGPRRRTRIACTEMGSGRTFAVHPLAEVVWTDAPLPAPTPAAPEIHLHP